MGIKRFTDKSKAKAFRNQKKKEYKHTKLEKKGKSPISLKRGRHWVSWGNKK